MAEVFLRNPKSATADANSVVVRDANGEIAGVWDAVGISGGVDLDTFTNQGLYVQGSFANADVALHYPEDDVAGILEVITYEVGTAKVQRYTARDGGKIWTRYYTGSAWNPWVRVDSTPEFVAGMMMMWAPNTALIPAGWLVCDGTAVSRTTYATLFAQIGTLYGVGNGSTTFNLPDLTSKFPRGGVGNPGGVGGLDTHTHTLTDAVADVRMATSGSTVYGRNRTSPSSRDMDRSFGAATPMVTASFPSSAGIALTGSTDSASNVPPYVGLMFIIKT
jgi:microcystin-dependent protein